MSRWEIKYMTGLQELYLLDPARPPRPPGLPQGPSTFDVLLELTALGAALLQEAPRLADVARAAAATNIALGVLLFHDTGVSDDDAIALLGELQEQHLTGWSGRLSVAAGGPSTAEHLLDAFRNLVALDTALGVPEPDPATVETYAAALANRVMVLAFEAGVFAVPASRPEPEPAVAEG